MEHMEILYLPNKRSSPPSKLQLRLISIPVLRDIPGIMDGTTLEYSIRMCPKRRGRSAQNEFGI